MDFLKKLLDTPSPSGFEGEAAKLWKAEAEAFADEVRFDVHGNTIATLNPGGKPKVMLAGHIDEIGLMVKSIDEQGFLKFAPIGGWDPQILPGQRVKILTKQGVIKGVIGKKPIHLMRKPEERTKATQIEEMFIDIGAKDKKEAEELVSVGDPAVIDYEFEILRGDLAVARGFDDRIGAFVVLEALRIAKELGVKAEVNSVATVQEEIGLRGATTSAFHIHPDVGIAVDVTFATDYPGMQQEKGTVGDIKLGGGPVIARGPNINHVVFELLVKTAEEKGIPYQVEGIPRGTGTDANAIQLSRGGVAAGLVSIPNRNMHTPVEMVHLGDVQQAAELLANFIAKLTPETDFTPWR